LTNYLIKCRELYLREYHNDLEKITEEDLEAVKKIADLLHERGSPETGLNVQELASSTSGK
jgi:hypothetical protein